MPKGMLNVFGKSIIQHQIETYRRNGIEEIIIVKGYFAEKIDFPGTISYLNGEYANTNMVESLFCASDIFSAEIIISYADILFEDKVLKAAIASKKDIGVIVDKSWKEYWLARYDKVDFDTESMCIDQNDKILNLGESDPPLNIIDGRYVGLIKLSEKGAQIFLDTYQKAKSRYQNSVWLNGRKFENVFMTDFLQEIINQGYDVYSIPINRGWLEFDTNEDFERTLEWVENNKIEEFFNKSQIL